MNLTVQEMQGAWRRHFAFRLEDLPDTELHWELATWQRAGAFDLTGICEREFANRRALLQHVQGGASANNLDRLARSVPIHLVGQIVEREAIPVVEAIRLAWWVGLRTDQAA